MVVGSSSKDVLVSAPENLNPKVVVRAIQGFSLDTNVQRELVGKSGDCGVVILTADQVIPGGDPNNIVGIDILDCGQN